MSKLQSTFLKPVLSGLTAVGLTYILQSDQTNNNVAIFGLEMSVPVFNGAVSAGSCLLLNTVQEYVLPRFLSHEMLVNNKIILMPLSAGAIGAGVSYLIRPDFTQAVGLLEVAVLHAAAEGISTYIQPVISQYLPH